MNELVNVNDSTQSIQKRQFLKRRRYFFVNLNPFVESHIIRFFSTDTKITNFNRYNLSNLKRNYQILNSFKNLEKNWNGSNAMPFSQQLIDKVFSIIQELEYQPQIFPTGRNSIQIEFEKKNGDYLEFEIFPDRIVAYKEFGNKEWKGMVDKEQVMKLTNEFNA